MSSLPLLIQGTRTLAQIPDRHALAILGVADALHRKPDAPTDRPRHQRLAGARRRSLLDLFFEEVDGLRDLSDDDKLAVKRRMRRRFGGGTPRDGDTGRQRQPTAEPTAVAESRAEGSPDASPHPAPAAPDAAHPTVAHVVGAVAGWPFADDDPEVEDDRRLAVQLHRCLSADVDGARRMAAYVHALQVRHEPLHRPHLIVVT